MMRMNRKQRAQSLVEFALIFPLVIFLITVFFDLGRAIYYFSALNNAVREGTRYAIVNDADPTTNPSYENNVKDTIILYAAGVGINYGNITVIKPVPGPPSGGGNYSQVTITVTYNFQPVTPGLALVLKGGIITIKTESSMRAAPSTH